MSPARRLAALGVALALVPAGVAAQGERDDFHRLGQINKASIVMLAEAGLVPEALGATIAAGIARVIAEQGGPGARRSSDYLDFEERLVAGEMVDRGGALVHEGRMPGAPRQRLETQCAGPGEEVEHPGADEIRGEPIEECYPSPVR